MNRQGNAGQARGGGRTASFADGNLIIDAQRERLRACVPAQDFAIGSQDEVVFEASADFGVASSGLNGEFLGGLSADFQEESESQRRGIEGRAQIGGSGREDLTHGLIFLRGLFAFFAGCYLRAPPFSACSSVFTTASALASSTMGARCCAARIAASFSCASSEQIAAVKLQSKVRVFEQVAGQNQDDALGRLDEALLDQLLETGERHRGGRLAADAIRPDFRLGLRNLDLADLLDRSTGGLEHPHRFLPGGGVADADGGGQVSASTPTSSLPPVSRSSAD